MKKYRIRGKSPLWYIKEILMSTWTIVFIGIILLVAFAFSGPVPEAEGETVKAEQKEQNVQSEEIRTYDIPLSADFQLHINELCEKYDVDMPLVLAIIGQESNYRAEAVGDGGDSIGLMQIQPAYHKQRMDKLGVTDLSDPYQNVAVGIDLLAELISENKGTEWAITAYNAGAGTADYNKTIGIRSEYAESVMMLREMIKND